MCRVEKADGIQEKETALCVFITPPGSSAALKYRLPRCRPGLGWPSRPRGGRSRGAGVDAGILGAPQKQGVRSSHGKPQEGLSSYHATFNTKRLLLRKTDDPVAN